MSAITPEMLDLLLFTLVVGCVAGLSFGLRALFNTREDPIARRIQASTAAQTFSEPAPIRVERKGPTLLETALKPVVQVAKPVDEAELQGLRSRLSYAGYRSERAMLFFLAAKVFFCVAGAVAYLTYDAYRAQPDNQRALYTIIAMIVGFYAPSIWLDQRGKERQGEIERSLPDALDLLVTCVEAGLGLEAALSRIATESGMASALLQSELLLTAREMRAGIGRGDAMRRLATRTGVAELKYLASVIVQTEVFGTSVSKSLRVMSDSMRIRRTQRAEERAATVAVKMTMPLVLCILPALFAILLGPALLNISSTLMPKLGGGG
jgi:tight adherence protein C